MKDIPHQQIFQTHEIDPSDKQLDKEMGNTVLLNVSALMDNQIAICYQR